MTTNMSRYWARRGWSVRLVLLGSRIGAAYDVEPGVEVIELNMLSESRSLLEAFRRNARVLLAVRRQIRAYMPDVVVGMMMTSGAIAGLAGAGLDVSVVAAERIHPETIRISPVWRGIRALGYSLADVVLAQTEGVAAWLRANVPTRKVEVIPNALAWPLPSGAPELHPNHFFGPERRVVISIGRLHEQKDFASLIRIFAKAAGTRPEWDLVILGEGPLRVELEQQIVDLGLKSRVLLPGWAGNLSDWYNRAELFALNSTSEGFPNGLLEAMAAGLAAISTNGDHGSHALICDGVDGFLVAQGDEASYVETLSRLMDDESLRRTIATRAIEVRERFAEDRVMQAWERLFVDINRRRTGA